MRTSTPQISVVIPCYNHGAYLPDTLESLWAQTFTDFEVVIINDGSTDRNTIDFLDKLQDERVRVIHTPNRGVSAARNVGIRESRGRYILPLDSDDKISPTYMKLAVSVLDASPDVAVVYCERVLFGEKEGMEPLPPFDSERLLFDNCIYPAAFFRKQDWHLVGGYCESMIYGWEDWDFWISLSELKKQVVKIPEPLFHYRVRSNSRDHSLKFLQKLAMMSLIIARHKLLYVRNAGMLAVKIFSLVTGIGKSR